MGFAAQGHNGRRRRRHALVMTFTMALLVIIQLDSSFLLLNVPFLALVTILSPNLLTSLARVRVVLILSCVISEVTMFRSMLIRSECVRPNLYLNLYPRVCCSGSGTRCSDGEISVGSVGSLVVAPRKADHMNLQAGTLSARAAAAAERATPRASSATRHVTGGKPESKRQSCVGFNVGLGM